MFETERKPVWQEQTSKKRESGTRCGQMLKYLPKDLEIMHGVSSLPSWKPWGILRGLTQNVLYSQKDPSGCVKNRLTGGRR